ncbi:MAG: iron-sulfur cluster assembly accessory protein [Alphaproteobacteria bacterium]|nr:iron-sulfur cluster assembly accessory protein [Alphaproteobacteria bacterium]TAD90978.1 MAG: iron-sulfur cluster assembly accessory protein [Alphaproteobacteria bacterium]
MLTVTDRAADAIKRVIAGAATDVQGLRVVVASGGCSGFKYQLALERASQDGDSVVEQSGVKVFVDADSLVVLDGTTVDYVEDITGGGFVFENPNAKQSCGCGKSFSC